MAQQRRRRGGLGRGLEALIPQTQAEEPAQNTRPTDIFFPDHVGGETSASGEGDRSPAARRQGGVSREVTDALLQPRKRASKKASAGSARPVSRETSAQNGATTAVSRETGSDRHGEALSSSRIDGSAVSHTTGTQPDAVAAPHLHAEHSDGDDSVQAAVDGTRESAQHKGDGVSRETGVTVAGGATDAGRAGNSGVSRETSGTSSDDALPTLVPVPGTTFAQLPIELISPNPRQPRQVFDDDQIDELAASIREVGLLQPIVVRRSADASDDQLARYEIIMGERRFRASQRAGLETIPALVRYTDDENLLRDALLENLHRVELNPLEEAAAYQQLLDDFGCSHTELSQRIARSRSQISNTLRLLKLPALVQRRVAAGVLSAGHARALLGLPDAAAMERLAQRIVAEGLSVRATEEIVSLHDEHDSGTPPRTLRARPAMLPALSQRLSDAFDTRVKVTRGAKKGRITIEFAGDEDLERLIAALAPGTSIED